MANRMSPGLPVVAIDTGFLPPETYRYMEEPKERLDLNLIVVNNSEWSAARIEAIHGKLWEKDDELSHKLYGSLTKTTPLAAALDAIEPLDAIYSSRDSKEFIRIHIFLSNSSCLTLIYHSISFTHTFVPSTSHFLERLHCFYKSLHFYVDELQ